MNKFYILLSAVLLTADFVYGSVIPVKSKHPTLAAFVWASSFTTFARKTLCLYSTKQMFFGFVALQ